MRQIIPSQRPDARHAIAESLWLIASFVVLLALGDVVIVATLAIAVVAITAGWWIRRSAARRARRGDAALAPVSQLPASPCPTPRAAACGPWHRHRAA